MYATATDRMFTIAALQGPQIDLSRFDKVEVKILTQLTEDSSPGGDWMRCFLFLMYHMNVRYKSVMHYISTKNVFEEEAHGF